MIIFYNSHPLVLLIPIMMWYLLLIPKAMLQFFFHVFHDYFPWQDKKTLLNFVLLLQHAKEQRRFLKFCYETKRSFFFWVTMMGWKKTLLIFLFCCCNAWKNERSCFIEFFCFVVVMHEGTKDNLFPFLLFGWAKEWKKSFINFFGCDAWSNERKPHWFYFFCCCNKCTFIAMIHKRTPLPCFSLCKLSKLVHHQGLRKNYKNKCR